MSELWQASWFASASKATRELWRGVEAQHRVATMRLVDSVEEQHLLEQLLDASKPPLPAGAGQRHYLLFTPFRYASPQASRFRVSNGPGAFYGADERRTVAAELAYWRWKFLMDSDSLRSGEIVSEHTFFLARFSGIELDITVPPWLRHRKRWRDPADYSACHSLACAIREGDLTIDSVRFESARAEGQRCNVVFTPACLSLPRLHLQQTWTCKTTATRVLWAHDSELMEFAQADGPSARGGK